MADVIIQGDFAVTLEDNPQRFFLHDNQLRGRRLIIFASNACLVQLGRSRDLFMDGNFKLSPAGLDFQQLYVIRGSLGDSAVSLVYALLEGKEEDTYVDLFQAVLAACNQRGIQLNPQNIKLDFEQATINAARRVFPNSNVSGCFYHLCQVCIHYLLISI